MKKFTLLFGAIMLLSAGIFAQTSEGDIQMVQKYFGVEKMALVRDYMKLTPKQDSLFWKDYNAYETERMAMGKRRIQLTDDYMKAVENTTEAKATELVDRSVANEIGFKNLQKKYFTKMTKTIGPVKAAQFYQLENYLNNIINLMIQENIPFIGEMEQKHDKK
jgi:hypothetical protein